MIVISSAPIRMNTTACLDQFQVHVFKIKIVDGLDEQQMWSLSTYSISSEFKSSMDPFSDKLLSFSTLGTACVQHPDSDSEESYEEAAKSDLDAETELCKIDQEL